MMRSSLLFYFITYCACLQCKNERNEDVEWFMLYKIPKIAHENDKNIANGLGYVYITANNYENWQVSSKSINDSDSIVGLTLKPFYEDKKNFAYLLYNDQPPNAPVKPSKGHTKGFVLSDTQVGFWLIHSVPHFINFDTYSYPKTGVKNGQSFLCISLNLENLNLVGFQLQYNEPQIYFFNIPSTFQRSLSNVFSLTHGETVNHSPWMHKANLTATNGTNFVSFAKSRKFAQDLYMDYVGPDLASDLLVESWLDGQGKMPSNCSHKFHIFNVEEIEMDLLQINFKSTQDHSKWAVSKNDENWICIGDINRMEHQEERGGGTVCLKNANIAQHYKKLIRAFEECNNLS